MKKIFLIVLSSLLLVACSGLSRKGDTPDLVGKTYVMDGTIAGSTIDITFEEDQLSGSAGVNRYFAPYLLEGNSLSVSVVGTTRMMGPRDLTEQEMDFVKKLENSESLRAEGNKLVITTTEGEEMVFTEKEITFEEAVEGKTFTLAGSMEDHRITILFEEGRIAGSAGVNRYSTSYELEGDKISISPQIISTMMAGPEDAMNQEAAYLADLAKAAKAEVEGDRLVLTLEDGRELIFE